MKTTKGSRRAPRAATCLLTFAVALMSADAFAQSTRLPFALPDESPATGLLADPEVGKTLRDVEANPPAISRGLGNDRTEKLFAARCRSVVFIIQRHIKDGRRTLGTGTGSIVSIDGHVLTAAHVVEGASEVAVGVFPSCKPGARPELFPAKIVRTDPGKDLALLRLTKLPSDISIMPIGKLDEVRTGTAVMMIGHPRQLLMSLSQGMVSAIRPDFNFGSRESPRRATVIQTDGALNPGNSGGPMLSASGNLVGVNSFILGKTSAGLNFAVSVTDVRDFLAGKSSRTTVARAAPAPRKPTPAKSACKPKELREWRKDKSTVKAFDYNCTGKTNAILIIPDDPKKRSTLGLDRNGDAKPDVIYVLDKKGKPLLSNWDDNFDGKYDYRGAHTNGDWAPYKKTPL